MAVALVFFQHYCTQFITYTSLTGWTEHIARSLQHFGNYGVELFFVLSGFLIYEILLRKRPPFLLFMARRAQRLYPAFFVALAIGVLIDIVRPEPKIPNSLVDGTLYLTANALFIPGLFPVIPLFSVNWSLSYEWWFYATATFLFSTCHLAALSSCWRVTSICGAIIVLLALSAGGLSCVLFVGCYPRRHAASQGMR